MNLLKLFIWKKGKKRYEDEDSTDAVKGKFKPTAGGGR